MNLLNTIFKKNDHITPTPVGQIVIPKGKEIPVNTGEENNIRIINENKLLDFNLKVFGRSLFQNLILTASATFNGEVIPIKCSWKRTKRDIVVYIKDINSNSYIPNAEDIGYSIEVEVIPIDTEGITLESPVIGIYGPIILENDMKNTIELLLTSGGTKFSCYLYDINEQEKVTNKEIIIYINTTELKLVEADYNGKEQVLEVVKYHQFNPLIKLHPYDSTRFSLKFFEFNFDIDRDKINGGLIEIDKLNQILRSEYNLIAMSKQCRELIYLLSHFFLIDEKLKNGKLFTYSNYNILPSETKVGVTDLIAEIKTLREENSIVMTNMKYLEKVNRKLKQDIRNLEEDFQITLESINNSDYRVHEDIEKNSEKFKEMNSSSNSHLNLINNTLGNSNNFFDLKRKYDELRESNSSLTAREKALREENKEMILEIEILKNCNTEQKAEMRKLFNRSTELESEFTSIKKNYSLINESREKLQQEYDSIAKEHKDCTNKKFQTENKSEKEIQELKRNFDEMKKANDNLQYENKNLLVQRSLLTNQKNDIQKEYEKLKNEKLLCEDKANKLTEHIDFLSKTIKENDQNTSKLRRTIEDVQKENLDVKNKLELVQIEHNIFRESYEKMIEQTNMLNISVSGNHVKITTEEYEEYDTLKRDKDEYEATIMQLKSNNEAKDLEIENLKMLIDSLRAK